MSKFAIDPGHGCYSDTGAEEYLNEQNCALDIANRVISKLQSLGHTAYNVRPSSASSVTNSLQQRCDNAVNADYLVSIHLNAGGGKGSEVFAMSAAGNTLASNVLKCLVSLGFVNRDVKDGSSLYVINHSKPVAILIEVCFVDTQSDADLYNKLGAESVANAIVQGLTGQIVQADNSNSDFIRSVQHDLQRVSCLAAGEVNADGVLGPKTKAAIKQFRYVVGLPDGENIDSQLIDALNAITKMTTIGVGWSANIVATRFIQWFIGINSKNGVFDANTTAKVKEWQKKEGIWGDPDGAIRQKDWSKILK
ncbi:N-acetylmuramoyl-L-alanine amidase [Clostridium sp. OS1-26]|uniref:N-acetylmuramoyl-L-alanine amidase n=1 Tax=Clostridium sp. OS1-26 TaxID=3070681 RepID=UPI0027E09C7E|nr:N-acetylmuramoyl-L-alanine amidase [Clostridium sp. OS1-26]WML35330.1 N-acetylmuramoyl-L-alanine amidase [Clostridium sp. OS1-26]